MDARNSTKVHRAPVESTPIQMADRSRRPDLEADPSGLSSPKTSGIAMVQPTSSECDPVAISPQYSTFTRTQKWLIVSLCTFAASFSPLSSFIFFPAIPTLAKSLHVSTGKINLTVTSYLISAGLAPAVLGDLADTIGRRPVYLFMMTTYCVANIGLALQNSWAGLFVLRMVQSVGSASTIAVGYGIVSDIATPAERGHFVSGIVLGPNIATAVGPILGGVLTQFAGWRWIFWLLAILSGTSLLLLLLLLPETARCLVGDGSVEVPTLYRAPLLGIFSSPVTSHEERSSDDERQGCRRKADRIRCRWPNPLASLRLLIAPDCLLIVLIFAVFYMNLSCVQASTSTLFVQLYGVSELDVGLIYLPAGIGSILGVYGAGHLLKYDYQMTAKKHGVTVDEHRDEDITNFPIEEARLRSVNITTCSVAIATIGYGWALQYKTHIVVPLILQFIIGSCTAVVFNTSGTLLTDVHPRSPSTASAANSIVRCLLAGGGLAIVQIVINGIGVQWTFTLLGLICLSCVCLVEVERKHGKVWRGAMHAKGIKR